MGYVVFKGFLSFLTMGFFVSLLHLPLSSWQCGSYPSLGQIWSWPQRVATPVRKEEESWRFGSRGLAAFCLQNFIFLQKNAFLIPLRGALGHKILLSLVCELICLFLLYFIGKGKWIKIVTWPLGSYTSLWREKGGFFPCARQTLCKAMSQALMFLL